MPRPKKPDYLCPRCNYSTGKKTNMKRHLYNNKTPCCATLQLIELTDNIKTIILQNRRYIAPVVPLPNNIINNINQNLTFILNNLTEHKGINISNLENKLYDKYFDITKMISENKKEISLNQSDLVNLIDDITDPNQQNDQINILYDPKKDMLLIYQIAKWQNFLTDDGINVIVKSIKTNFLDIYEQFLIKKLTLGNTNILRYQNLLNEYYNFIGIFDLAPFVCGQSDEDILDVKSYNEKNKFSLESYYSQYYKDICKNITKISKSKTYKYILDIIKSNSQISMNRLNKEIFTLLNVDHEFIQKIT